jgi:quercetin dioxygenase-like cupin family protein/alkylhydroperoxidase/carboxymuconolactone decarboxylase family protein YurZ
MAMAAPEADSSARRGLDAKQRKIVGIAAFTARGDLPQLEIALAEGLDAGLTINEINEVLIQMYAYAGFPRSLNGIGAFMKVVEARKARGLVDPQGQAARPLPEGVSSLELGTRTQTRLMGRPSTGGYIDFAPGIDRFLKGHLFGDIFGRGLLDDRTREIATVAALASMTGVEPQLRGHFLVARNIGVTRAQLEELVDELQAKGDPERARAARSLLASLQDSSKASGTSKPQRVVVTPRKSNPPIKGGNDHFTGAVEVAMPFQAGGPSRYHGAEVSFQAAGRTHWHQHPLGQLLIVTSGKGRVQSWGDPIQELNVGDVVWIPPYQKHWHGASPDQAMTHIAITEPLSGNATEWMEPVSDEQFAPSRAAKERK